ncbi:hypothetical protein [Limosilactobacillus fermentum]
MPADHRYIQPQSAKEAMELIQKLFNSYRNAPLTSELLNYHNNLVARLNDDIMAAATTEGPKRVEQLTGMIELMQAWTRIRLSGRPFLGKMRHFKLEDGNQHQQFPSCPSPIPDLRQLVQTGGSGYSVLHKFPAPAHVFS